MNDTTYSINFRKEAAKKLEVTYDRPAGPTSQTVQYMKAVK